MEYYKKNAFSHFTSKVSVLVLCLSCVLCSAFAQQKFTLEGAISYAIEHNLQLKVARLTQSLDDANLTQSKVNLLPDFSATIQQQNNSGRATDPVTNAYITSNTHYLYGYLGGSVVLFGGFGKINQIKQNRYQLLADQSRVEKAKNDAIINVLTYYLEILSFQDLIVSAREKSEVSKLQLDNDQKKLDVGNLTEADLLQDKATYDMDIQSITTYQNNLDIAKTSLQQFMDLDPTQPFEVARPDSVTVDGLHTTYDAVDVYKRAMDILPDVKSEIYYAQALKKAVVVARSAYYPYLTLSSQLQSAFSPSFTANNAVIPFHDQLKNNLTKFYGFNLNIPIFNGWTYRVAVKKAKILYQQQLLQEEIVKTTLNKTIVQAVIDLRAGEKKFEADHSSTEALKKAFYFSQLRYNVGLLNSLDFNLAKSKYTVAEATEIQDKYNLIFEAKVIDFYLGNKISLNQ